MTNKQFNLAFSVAVIALLAVPATAQTAQPPAQQLAPAPPAAAAAASPALPAAGQASSLMGKPLHDAANKPIGKIAAATVGRNGWVSSVIVEVPPSATAEGYLVGVRWQDLRVSADGVVSTPLEESKLAALPRVRDPSAQDAGVQVASERAQADSPRAAAAAAPPKSTGVPTREVIGASVLDPNQRPIGRVFDVTLDGSGVAQSLVIARADPLGLASDEYADVPFADVKIMRQGEDIFVIAPLAAPEVSPNTEILQYRKGPRY